MGGYALLVGGNEIHSKKPLHERKFSVLKNSTDKTGEVSVAQGAVKTSAPGHSAMVLAAIWANDVPVFPSAVNYGLSAYLVRGEV